LRIETTEKCEVSIRPQKSRAIPASLRACPRKAGEAGWGSTGFFNSLLKEDAIIEPMSLLTIQPFQPEDQAEAKALILEGLRERWGAIDPARNPDLDDIGSAYAGAVFLVGRIGDRIVATGALVARGEGCAEIVRMSVARDLRRRGIGSAILRRLLEQAASAGRRKIILETTSTWTDAIAFYRRHGFRPTHIQSGDTYFELSLPSGGASG
jgi:GNAT superfamily N-acetyltransferase